MDTMRNAQPVTEIHPAIGRQSVYLCGFGCLRATTKLMYMCRTVMSQYITVKTMARGIEGL